MTDQETNYIFKALGRIEQGQEDQGKRLRSIERHVAIISTQTSVNGTEIEVLKANCRSRHKRDTREERSAQELERRVDSLERDGVVAQARWKVWAKVIGLVTAGGGAGGVVQYLLSLMQGGQK
jgi:hypothetical protein